MSRDDAESALYDVITTKLDAILLSVPKITDPVEWKVIKSRFDLMCEQLEFFATTSEDQDRRIVFRNAMIKLQKIEPRALACHV